MREWTLIEKKPKRKRDEGGKERLSASARK